MSATLTNEDVALIKSVLYNNDLDVDVIAYSGRCMYGEQCIGIVTDNVADTMFVLGVALSSIGGGAHNLLEKLTDEEIRTDSMGRREVVYFQNVTPPDSLVDLDDEDDED